MAASHWLATPCLPSLLPLAGKPAMLSVLIEGTLVAAPVARTSSKGTPFVTAQLRCNAEDGESVLCSVIAFQAAPAEALITLTAGDTLAVAGPAALSQWEKNGEHKVGLKVTATRVLTVYDAGMRRKVASQGHDHGLQQDGRPPAPPTLSDRNRPVGRHADPAPLPRRLADMENDEPM